MCNIRHHGHIEKFIQATKSAAGGHHRYNFVLERVGEACPGNIVVDFFMLLYIPPSLSPLSFQTIRISSDRFLWKLYICLHQRDYCHVSLVLIPINLGHLLWKRSKFCRHVSDSADKSPAHSEASVIAVCLSIGFWWFLKASRREIAYMMWSGPPHGNCWPWELKFEQTASRDWSSSFARTLCRSGSTML